MPSFALTDTQKEMVAAARAFGREVLEPAEIALDRVAVADEAFQSETFRRTMAAAFELGFHKMTMGAQHGGLGLDTRLRCDEPGGD